jgi:crotonobetainyl-CoA:carnitine CoA-transferase CaiB-like acyl-CoA transferase
MLREIMAERFLTRSRDDWAATLAECDVPFAPVLTIAEALDDAQVQALGSVVAVDHPTQGRVTGIQCPVLFDGERPRSRITPPPTAGEHTAAILDAPAVPWIARRSS